jgi:acyl carrier protein
MPDVGIDRSGLLLAVVLEVWGEVTGKDVQADSNFFALIGDSLAGISIALELAERLSLDVPITLVFDHETPHLQAEFLNKLHAE